jgi:hypothetical protein
LRADSGAERLANGPLNSGRVFFVESRERIVELFLLLLLLLLLLIDVLPQQTLKLRELSDALHSCYKELSAIRLKTTARISFFFSQKKICISLACSAKQFQLFIFILLLQLFISPNRRAYIF